MLLSVGHFFGSCSHGGPLCLSRRSLVISSASRSAHIKIVGAFKLTPSLQQNYGSATARGLYSRGELFILRLIPVRVKTQFQKIQVVNDDHYGYKCVGKKLLSDCFCEHSRRASHWKTEFLWDRFGQAGPARFSSQVSIWCDRMAAEHLAPMLLLLSIHPKELEEEQQQKRSGGSVWVGSSPFR